MDHSGPARVADAGALHSLAVWQGIDDGAVLPLAGNVAQIGLVLGGDGLRHIPEGHQGLRVRAHLFGGFLVLGGLDAVIGELRHIQVHLGGNAGNFRAAGILPHIPVSAVVRSLRLWIRLRGILGHPDLVVFPDPLRLPPLRQLAGRGIEHPPVAQLFDLLQKGQGHIRPLLGGHAVLAAVLIVKALAVEDDGVGNGILGSQIGNPDCLLLRLLGGDGSGEEVAPHGDPCLAALLEVIAGVAVLYNDPIPGRAVAQPDHGELRPGGGHLLPVHGTLVLGHVHPQAEGLLFLGLFAAGKPQEHSSQQKQNDPPEKRAFSI